MVHIRNEQEQIQDDQEHETWRKDHKGMTVEDLAREHKERNG